MSDRSVEDLLQIFADYRQKVGEVSVGLMEQF